MSRNMDREESRAMPVCGRFGARRTSRRPSDRQHRRSAVGPSRSEAPAWCGRSMQSLRRARPRTIASEGIRGFAPSHNNSSADRWALSKWHRSSTTTTQGGHEPYGADSQHLMRGRRRGRYAADARARERRAMPQVGGHSSRRLDGAVKHRQLRHAVVTMTKAARGGLGILMAAALGTRRRGITASP